MKAMLRDSALMKELKPLEIAAYLRSTGWTQQSSTEGKWAVWIKDDAYEILLPLQREYRDYVLRMSEMLQLLEEVEQRSQLIIFNDLLATGVDVIRVRLVAPDLADGNIPIDEHVKIAQQAREMMLSAACSTIQPKAVLPTRRPIQAMDYLKGVRIGQSERGSHILTIHSRVAPLLKSGQQGVLEVEEPFPRQVVGRLACALNATQRAAEQAAVSEDLQSFNDAITEGVSANLCEAITGLAGWLGEYARRVDISFSWSRYRPVVQEMPTRVVFQEDRMPVIAEAGRLLRENSLLEDCDLQGPVVKLERHEGQGKGRVTILGFVDEKPRKISMLLDEQDYQIAIDAHGKGQTISCSGTLRKAGRGFELQSCRFFYADMD
ncbi:MAG: hypothetical protein G8237_11205 [Magnetococcales bacterium]|nr:hypothetical protein [Magnetococcales bacterium]NGZ06911.1 hypothetical protein [Magnetococcales bacterium]